MHGILLTVEILRPCTDGSSCYQSDCNEPNCSNLPACALEVFRRSFVEADQV
jgi:hypothetical protein